MSALADKTGYKALSILARMVKEFDRLHHLDMTASDDWDACQARNLMEGIVQANGYEINYNENSRRPLFKSKRT